MQKMVLFSVRILLVSYFVSYSDAKVPKIIAFPNFHSVKVEIVNRESNANPFSTLSHVVSGPKACATSILPFL
jgi:hypothetical protein